MSVLIADIGGSSSRWALLEASGNVQHRDDLPGFNPASGDPTALIEALRSAIGPWQVDRVVAYGAGCGHVERQDRMRSVLAMVLPHARIDVHTDLLGSARAVYGSGEGVVLILGTGMNAGHFDGTVLHTPMPSLGYILGDECSGADLGKHALVAALHDRMPNDLRHRVFPDGISMEQVAPQLYRGASPQAWLASFARPLLQARDHLFATALIAERCDRLAGLLAHYFGGVGTKEVRATGSIAFAMRAELAAALAKHGFALGAIVPSPMPGLVDYHRQAVP